MPEIIVKLGDRIVNRYRFDKDLISIGRARDNDVVIENLSVSRNHARINREGDDFILSDLNSANGSMVNGHRVSRTPIKNNDLVQIGKHTLVFLEVEETRFVENDAPAPSSPAVPKKQSRYPSRTPVVPPSSTASSSSSSSSSVLTSKMIGLLTVMEGRQKGREYRVLDKEVAVGRSTRNQIRIHDWQASSSHATIRREDNAFYIRDCDSWHGTIVNDETVRETKLRDGDKIKIGETVLAFRLAEPGNIPPPAELSPIALPVTDFEAEEVVMSQPDSSGSLDLHLEADMGQAIDQSFQESELVNPLAQKTPIDHPTRDTNDLTGFDDDEFAPFTEEELEALEAEESVVDEDQEREDLRLSWEMVEDEKQIELGADSEKFSLIEDEEALRREEEAAADLANMASMGRPARIEEEDLKREDAEEEGELFTGEVPDRDPIEEIAAPAAEDEDSGKASSSSSSISGVFAPPPELTPKVQKEIALWEKALKNKSRIIRKNAAKELKRLTGKDYDWKSEPSGH